MPSAAVRWRAWRSGPLRNGELIDDSDCILRMVGENDPDISKVKLFFPTPGTKSNRNGTNQFTGNEVDLVVSKLASVLDHNTHLLSIDLKESWIELGAKSQEQAAVADVVGVVSQPALNGLEVEMIEFTEATGRYTVRLCVSTEEKRSMNLKPVNLIFRSGTPIQVVGPTADQP